MAGNGVTTYSGKLQPRLSPDGTDGRYEEVIYGPLDFAQTLTQSTSVGLTTLNTQIGDKVPIATGDGSSTSNIAGIAPSTGNTIDFLMRVPSNFNAAAASYLDIYYLLTGGGTKGDAVQFNGAYNLASVNATTVALATATTTTGITNSTRRVLATSKSNGYIYKDTITVAASTFTADTMPQFRITALGTYTQPELRIAKIVHRYARNYL